MTSGSDQLCGRVTVARYSRTIWVADVQRFSAVAGTVEASAGGRMFRVFHETGRNENVGVNEHAGQRLWPDTSSGPPVRRPHVVVNLLAADCEAFRPRARIMWWQDLPDGEPPLPHGRSGRRWRYEPVYVYRRLRLDFRLWRKPFGWLPGARVAVDDVYPQGSVRSCRMGQVVSGSRLRLAEAGQPFRLGANGEKMTVERRIPVSGGSFDDSSVSYGGHERHLGKSLPACASMSTALLIVNET